MKSLIARRTGTKARHLSMHNAFTLIELLVVIAIIAILAAILFPVFAKARDKARQNTCLSNLKQIGLGLMQYAQDYDETMPLANYGVYQGLAANHVGTPKWMDMMQTYVKSAAVYSCPTAQALSQLTDTRNLDYHRYIVQPPTPTAVRKNANYGSYVLNGAYTSTLSGLSARSPVGRPLSDIADSAGTILVTETGTPTGNANAVIFWTDYRTNPVLDKTTKPFSLKKNTTIISYMQHTDAVNILFCDGHAKLQRGEQLVQTHPSGRNNLPICYFWTIEAD